MTTQVKLVLLAAASLILPQYDEPLKTFLHQSCILFYSNMKIETKWFSKTVLIEKEVSDVQKH